MTTQDKNTFRFAKQKCENGYILRNLDGSYVRVEYNYNFGVKETEVYAENKNGRGAMFKTIKGAKEFCMATY